MLRYGACLFTVTGTQNPVRWSFPARSFVLGASSAGPLLADSCMLSETFGSRLAGVEEPGRSG